MHFASLIPKLAYLKNKDILKRIVHSESTGDISQISRQSLNTGIFSYHSE